MDENNSNLISMLTVRLKINDSNDSNNSNNSIIGTGVLYCANALEGKIFVLTAAHCLFVDGDKFQEKRDSICIDIYSPQEKKYKSITVENIDENLLSKNENEDIAIIILDKEVVDTINRSIPKIQVIRERKSFTSFTIKGFPKATKGEELAAVSATWVQEMTETKRFQLQIDADYTETNAKGFSGAGIFLEADHQIYLYGILTRYRGEEKGKIIYCQYIDSINNCLIKNFLPSIDYSYLGENGLTSSFFAEKIEREIKNLGPRFNEKLNFKLSIAQIFNIISNNTIYHQNIIAKIDKWLTKKVYIKDNKFIAEVEREFETLRQEVKDWLIEFVNHSVETEITLLPLIEKFKIFNQKISAKWDEIFGLSLKDENDKSQKSFDQELDSLDKIQDINSELAEDIYKLNVNLANNPTLIIEGEAGCGKSHLLGDIASQRKKQNLPTILLLGTTFVNTTIEENILKKLDLTCSFKDFLTSLNSIGQQINSRVLILIDAINEGAGVDLWKNQIAGFIDEIARYPAIGLVLTIRSTYVSDIIPDNFKKDPNITIITHTGFEGNEYGALKLFCEHYNLKLPNIPILNPEFSKPLLLNIICEAVKNLPDKCFPKGFNGINKTFELYKNSLKKKFEEKRYEYKYQNVVSKAIETLAVAIFNTEYHRLDIDEAVELFNSKLSKFPLLFLDLIEESVLIKMKYEYDQGNPKEFVLFSYQRLSDFFMAEELLKPYKTKGEIKNAFANDANFQKIVNKNVWSQKGIHEAWSILLPEKYELELFELIDLFFDKDVDARGKEGHITYTYEFFTQILLDSLKWRDIGGINDKKITNWLEKNGKFRYDEWWYTLTELAATPNHPFNGDRLHKILLRCSMPERDSFWQNYIRYYSGCDDKNIAFPLKRLIDWAWLPNISSKADFETARLVAQTLAWILSSTYIALRDKTTKALVNLLEQQHEALISILKAFEGIDDLYILDRLYAVAYACILRTEKDDAIKTIAQYIYDAIFKSGNPPEHILIRDYARNAIEYAIYKKVELDIDVKLIRPPYKSIMPTLPNSEDNVEIYRLDDDTPDFKHNYGFEHNEICNSVIDGIDNFGRYEVSGQVNRFLSFSFREEGLYNNFDKKLKDEEFNSLPVKYWIIKRVFELGYDRRLHGEYDHSIYPYNRHENAIERIGKKYQWIALYEILANLADNYKLQDEWGSDIKYTYTFYKGAWQLYVRNIDPTLTIKNDEDDDTDNIKHSKKEWWEDSEYIHWNQLDAEWVKTTADLVEPKQVIEKKDTHSEEWLHLQHYTKWREPKKIGLNLYDGRIKDIWYTIQGLLVKKSDKQKTIKYLKNKNFWGRWLPENEDGYSRLINREKFWSPAYLDSYKNKEFWETIQDTKYKVIVATESANGYIENDKSGANRSYNIPCKYIFEGMKLQYAPIDGNLKNNNNETIVMNSNPRSVLIRKKDLVKFLEDRDLDIIWTLLGEKLSADNRNRKEDYYTRLCGVYYLENGKLEGELKMYNIE